MLLANGDDGRLWGVRHAVSISLIVVVGEMIVVYSGDLALHLGPQSGPQS